MCIAQGALNRIFAPSRSSFQRPAFETYRRRFGAHETVVFQGDLRTHVYILEEGWVKCYLTLIDGQRQIVAFSNAGSILGMDGDTHHAAAIEAVTDIAVIALPVSRLEELMERDASLAAQMLRQLGRQLGAAQSQLAAVGAQSAEQKLATFLLSVSDLCAAADRKLFELPMRRSDMAEFLGLRLETVSRKMSEFQRRGWVRMVSLYVGEIVNRDVLQELADGGEAAPPRRAA